MVELETKLLVLLLILPLRLLLLFLLLLLLLLLERTLYESFILVKTQADRKLYNLDLRV